MHRGLSELGSYVWALPATFKVLIVGIPIVSSKLYIITYIVYVIIYSLLETLGIQTISSFNVYVYDITFQAAILRRLQLFIEHGP